MPESGTNMYFSYTFDVFADYHQFYLQDEQAEEDTPDTWGDQLVNQMIAVAPGMIGIATARNTKVPVRFDLVNSRPDNDFTSWDHVAEASLEVSSDQVVVAGPIEYLPDARRFSVASGSYRVRAYYGGLGTISENGLKGEDYYHVALWPEEYTSPEVLKRWPQTSL